MNCQTTPLFENRKLASTIVNNKTIEIAMEIHKFNTSICVKPRLIFKTKEYDVVANKKTKEMSVAYFPHVLSYHHGYVPISFHVLCSLCEPPIICLIYQLKKGFSQMT